MDLTKSVQEAIDSSIKNWLHSHWPLGWIVTNPGLSFLLLLLAIILFWGLLGALGRSVQQGWIWVLRSPLKLLGLVRVGSDGFWRKIRLPKREQQIELLIQQLAENQRQQTELLAKLTALISQHRSQ